MDKIERSDLLVGQQLLKIRQARGEGMSDIATAIGLSAFWLLEYENGKYHESSGYGVLVELANYFGVPTDYFFTEMSVPYAEKSCLALYKELSKKPPVSKKPAESK